MVTFKCVYNNDSAFNIGDYTNHYKFHIDSSIENIDLNLKSIPKCLEAGIGGQATEEESQDDFISFRLDFKASKRTINKTIDQLNFSDGE